MKIFLRASVVCVFLTGVFLFFQNACAVTFELEGEKSIKIENNSSAFSVTISNSSKIDYCSYSLTSSDFSFGKDYSSTSIMVLAYSRTVITNPGTESIFLSSTNAAFTPTIVSGPALAKGTMKAGKNYEFSSTYSTTVTIKNSSGGASLYDYVNYNNDGSIPSGTTSAPAFVKNSSLTATTIPIKGKTVFSVQGSDLNFWCSYEVFNNYITMIERQAPAFVQGVLEAGKNYKFTSSYSSDTIISSDSNAAALYDYANYKNDGTVQFSANAISGSIPLATKGTVVVSPVNGNINYWYPYDLFGKLIIKTEIQNPALFKGVIPADTTRRFVSNYIKNITISNNIDTATLYDYVNYSSNGSVEFSRKSSSKTITMPPNGTTVITSVGSDLTYWIPYDFYTQYIIAAVSLTPALSLGVLESGKNYEFINDYIRDIAIVNDSSSQSLFDYVTYSADNSSVFSWNCSISTLTVKLKGKTDISPIGGDINFWYPYDLYTCYVTLNEKETPALAKGVIEAGKTREIINSCFSDVKIFYNSGSLLYDYAIYNSIMSNNSFSSGASANNTTVPMKGRLVITSLNGNVEYYYPYDLYNPYITVKERENPALFKGVIKVGKNFEFKSGFVNDITIVTDSRSAALNDTANYKFDGSILFDHNSTNTNITVYCNGRTVISSLTGDIKFWMPYDIYNDYVTVNEIAEPALYVGVLRSGKNYEFRNLFINKIDISNDSNTASLFDYVSYNNDETLNFERNVSGKPFTVQYSARTIVSSVHGDINYWYPYNIFTKYVTVSEYEIPALSKCAVSRGKKYEFTNIYDRSIVIKNDASRYNNIDFDFVIYNKDGKIVRTGNSSYNSISLGAGEHVIITCDANSARDIEFYGVYGSFTNKGIIPSGDPIYEYSEGFIIQNVTSQLTSPYSVKAVAYISNYSDLPKDASVIIGLYDNEQKLYETYYISKQFVANEMAKIEHEFIKDDVFSAYTIKAFVLKDITSIMPLTNSKCFSFGD